MYNSHQSGTIRRQEGILSVPYGQLDRHDIALSLDDGEYMEYLPEDDYEMGFVDDGGSVHNRRMFVLVSYALAVGVGMFFAVSLLITAPPIVAREPRVEQAAVAAVAAQPVVASGAISAVFSPEVQHWAPQIVEWASEWDLDPNLVATVMQIESCGDPYAESHAGAQGLFQVMPFHFASGESMKDPATNAFRGMKYLSERLVQTSGDVGRALAGYNGGHVAAAAPYDNWAHETQRYFYWGTGIYDDAKNGRNSSERLQEWMNAGGASLCRQAATSLGLTP